MIQITDKYFIYADSLCYIVKEKKNTLVKGVPTETFVNLTYHGKLTQAIQSVYDRLLRMKIAEIDMKLSDVLGVVLELNKEFDDKIKGLNIGEQE